VPFTILCIRFLLTRSGKNEGPPWEAGLTEP
jgi:hypothetical protein